MCLIKYIFPHLIAYPIERCFPNLRIPTAVLAGVCALLLLLLFLDISRNLEQRIKLVLEHHSVRLPQPRRLHHPFEESPSS